MASVSSTRLINWINTVNIQTLTLKTQGYQSEDLQVLTQACTSASSLQSLNLLGNANLPTTSIAYVETLSADLSIFQYEGWEHLQAYLMGNDSHPSHVPDLVQILPFVKDAIYPRLDIKELLHLRLGTTFQPVPTSVPALTWYDSTGEISTINIDEEGSVIGYVTNGVDEIVTQLDISNLDIVDTAFIKHLLSIQSLDISNTGISSFLGSLFGPLTNLTSLEARDNDLGDATASFVTGMSDVPSAYLDVRNNSYMSLTSGNVSDVRDLLVGGGSIQADWLARFEIERDNPALLVFKALPESSPRWILNNAILINHQLYSSWDGTRTPLYLLANLDNVTTLAITSSKDVSALSRLPNLERLELDYSFITDGTHISQAIQGLPINHLSLYFNRLDSAGITAIAETLDSTGLQDGYLDCRVSDSFVSPSSPVVDNLLSKNWTVRSEHLHEFTIESGTVELLVTTYSADSVRWILPTGGVLVNSGDWLTVTLDSSTNLYLIANQYDVASVIIRGAVVTQQQDFPNGEVQTQLDSSLSILISELEQAAIDAGGTGLDNWSIWTADTDLVNLGNLGNDLNSTGTLNKETINGRQSWVFNGSNYLQEPSSANYETDVWSNFVLANPGSESSTQGLLSKSYTSAGEYANYFYQITKTSSRIQTAIRQTDGTLLVSAYVSALYNQYQIFSSFWKKDNTFQGFLEGEESGPLNINANAFPSGHIENCIGSFPGGFFRLQGSIAFVALCNLDLDSVSSGIYPTAALRVNAAINNYYNRVQIKEGLMHHWKLDELTPPYLDSAGSSDLVSYLNNPDSVVGRVDKAAYFHSLDGYLYTPTNDLSGTQHWTMWLRMADVNNSYHSILTNDGSHSSTERGIELYYQNSASLGYLLAWRVSNRSIFHQTIVETPISLYTWYFLDFYFNSVTQEIGLSINNGPYIKENTDYSSLFESPFSLKIGNRGSGGVSTRMTLDDIRIYNRILTHLEVRHLYRLGKNNSWKGMDDLSWRGMTEWRSVEE